MNLVILQVLEMGGTVKWKVWKAGQGESEESSCVDELFESDFKLCVYIISCRLSFSVSVSRITS